MLEQNFWFFTFEIESGFHHLDINANFWKYFGFSWVFTAQDRFFIFNVLPFVVSSACYLLLECSYLLLRVGDLSAFFSGAILYIDDGIVTCMQNSWRSELGESFGQV